MSRKSRIVHRVPRPFNPQSLVYTIPQVADMLMVCQKTIRRLVVRGELVHRRIGTRILIPKTALENFVKRHHPTGNHRSE